MSDDSRDDIGFDKNGNPITVGDEARAAQSRIVGHPNARPVLVVAVLGDEMGVRVYGPPDPETAELLDQVAAMYRKALDASRGPMQ